MASEGKVVIYRVPSYRYRGINEAAEKLGVGRTSLRIYLMRGDKSIGPEKRARVKLITLKGKESK